MNKRRRRSFKFRTGTMSLWVPTAWAARRAFSVPALLSSAPSALLPSLFNPSPGAHSSKSETCRVVQEAKRAHPFDAAHRTNLSRLPVAFGNSPALLPFLDPYYLWQQKMCSSLPKLAETSVDASVDEEGDDEEEQHHWGVIGLLLSSTLKKRRTKMNKHKLRKRKKKMRLKTRKQ
uniref:Ribosomal protein mS38 C-terminal domain-containing protein n=1 Tax=Trieres chinensis TaxID=1514140 RepID=A0A7S2A3S1_TRICV|mmetsp:Transcript_3932/g.8362  ORF Transcript_3932/g.8362 Transcript_3932/m.8362 type:complete len:176 (+) Transcript_3932:17-544(+)